MNILFVAHSELSMTSGIHRVNLGLALRELGVDVAITVPNRPFAVPGSAVEDPLQHSRGIPAMLYREAAQFRFKNGAAADLVHATSAMQHVTRTTRALSLAHKCPYAVHLEDNEHQIAAALLQEMKRWPLEVQRKTMRTVTDPKDMDLFLAGAAGVTALIDRLLEFKPAGTPGLVVWPAAEDELFYPRPRDAGLLAQLRIEAGTKVIVYNGNILPMNVDDMNPFYGAILDLANSGTPVVLVRLGRDVIPVKYGEELKRLTIRLPYQPRPIIPRLLALADVLVQPGRPGPFNDYRFPSKLPEFFAMGKPVILPRTNIGLRVKDGEDALLLERGDSGEIAGKMGSILSDPELSSRLSAGARAFYERMFSWKRSAAQLLDFYQRLI